MSPTLGALPLPMLCGIFGLAAALVWLAGSGLVRFVDAVTRKTGLGQAFTGMLFLGGITSLPEVAAVSTASAVGNASLAINNLLGTASINILLLAAADIVSGRDALTRAAAKPAVMMQGVLSMLLAGGVAMVATAGDVAIWGIGVGSGLLALGALAALWISSEFEQRHVWEIVGEGTRREEEPSVPYQHWSLARLSVAVILCGLVILVAGFALSLAADAIAVTAELESGMVGFLLVGLATSLPEISSITAAVRLGRYQMAVGDIFGTNLFNILLIVLADLVYRGPPVLAEAGRFESIGAILAILVTGVFIIGLLERRDRTILRMGYDSVAAILIFAGGVYLLSRAGG